MVDDPFGLVGTVLDGKVQVEAAIGAGGFGVFYRGKLNVADVPLVVSRQVDTVEPVADQRSTRFVRTVPPYDRTLARSKRGYFRHKVSDLQVHWH